MTARLVALLVTASCSSAPTTPAPRAYTDQAGRQCTTTGAAPSTCDEAPAPSDACTVDYPTPCWDLFPADDDAGSLILMNCAACCSANGGAASASPADCTPVACQASADCPLDFDTCQGGLCTAQ